MTVNAITFWIDEVIVLDYGGTEKKRPQNPSPKLKITGLTKAFEVIC
jgi:hypothetical protein